jgi:hypothetical protein
MSLWFALAWSAACMTSVMLPAPAHAHGAVAIGLPENVGRDGVAMGVSWDLATENEAIAVALEKCRGFGGVPASTTKLCKTARTFQNQCAAAAFDPAPGTPGYGWAVAASSDEARSQAMDACKRSAGKGREQFCEVSLARCDGSAK